MPYKIHKGRIVFFLVVVSLVYWYIYVRKLPKGKLREGKDTSNTWNDVMNYGIESLEKEGNMMDFGISGPDNFFRNHLMGQAEEIIDPKRGHEKVAEDHFKDILGVTRCATTARAFGIYMCGSGGIGGHSSLIRSKHEIGEFRRYLETMKGQSLWEINVYREKKENAGHVFVIHQFGDQGEYWDAYMSFLFDTDMINIWIT